MINEGTTTEDLIADVYSRNGDTKFAAIKALRERCGAQSAKQWWVLSSQSYCICSAVSTIRKLNKIGYSYQAANYAANEYRRGIFNEKAWDAITTWLEGK